MSIATVAISPALKTSSRFSPLLVASTIYIAAAITTQVIAIQLAHGHFAYPLDDTYIHMAIAKNFAQHGVWGVTPFGFTSATSSPLYTLLLAIAYFFVGPAVWLPLAFNAIMGLVILAVADRMLAHLPTAMRAAALIAFGALIPLPTVAMLGMEHTLHIALTLLFAWRAAIVIEGKTWDWWLPILAACLSVARYEGLFTVAAAVFLLAFRRRFAVALTTAAGGIGSVALYGLISIAFGWHFLPNSVAIKGTQAHSVTDLIVHVIYLLWFVQPPLLILIAASSFILLSGDTPKWSRAQMLAAITFFTLLAHIATAEIIWSGRYEAYLIALSAITVFYTLPLFDFRSVSLWSFVVIGMLAYAPRIVSLFKETPQMSAAIYAQQIQMAKFIDRYYRNASIALNDIGAVSFYSEVHLCDLVGLSDSEIGNAKQNGTYTTEKQKAITEGNKTEIAIVYDAWFNPKVRTYFRNPLSYGPSLPAPWVRVGEWYSSDPRPIGEKTVSFYAVLPEERLRLATHLQDFEQNLPSSTKLLAP